MFLQNYAIVNALSLPGRMPGHRDYRCMVLPAFLTKKKVYVKYVEACKADGRQYMSERVFGNYWRELHPRIVSGNPRTDLCYTCQNNVSLVWKSRNKDLTNKISCVTASGSSHQKGNCTKRML